MPVARRLVHVIAALVHLDAGAEVVAEALRKIRAAGAVVSVLIQHQPDSAGDVLDDRRILLRQDPLADAGADAETVILIARLAGLGIGRLHPVIPARVALSALIGIIARKIDDRADAERPPETERIAEVAVIVVSGSIQKHAHSTDRR